MLTNKEKQLYSSLRNKSNSFEGNRMHADAPIVMSNPGGTAVAPLTGGTPPFQAQFDTQVFLQYYTLTGGAYTKIAPAALDASLQNKLPVFLFGHADFAAGYAKMMQNYPISGWVYGFPGVYGKDYFTPYAFTATVTANLINGDVVLPFTSPAPGGGTTTLALVVIRCTQVAYASLLESISSDRFSMNMLRYVLPDLTQLAQYAQQIGVYYQSLFGKFDSDSLSPISFKNPMQQQNGIIDIGLAKGFGKEDILATYIIYTNVETDLSFFVNAVNKLSTPNS